MILTLYIVFFNIGLLAFGGGYVVLSLIEKYVLINNAWINEKILIDLVTLSQLTPGPIAINAATFIGMRKAGILGAIIASLGIITPQIIILVIFINYIGLESKFLKRIMNGIFPVTNAFLLVICINFFKNSIFINGNFEIKGIIIFILTFILYNFKYKVINIMFISFLISILLYFLKF